MTCSPSPACRRSRDGRAGLAPAFTVCLALLGSAGWEDAPPPEADRTDDTDQLSPPLAARANIWPSTTVLARLTRAIGAVTVGP